MGRPARAAPTRAQKAAETRRRNARRATYRSIGQLLVVLVGGALAGGLAILAALPDASGPVPPVATLVTAAIVGAATLTVARRLRPIAQGRSRR